MKQNRQSPSANRQATQFAAGMETVRDLAELGIAEVAMWGLVGVQVRMGTVEDLKREVVSSVYWPRFSALAKAGAINDGWLPGALGQCVLGWAKGLG